MRAKIAPTNSGSLTGGGRARDGMKERLQPELAFRQQDVTDSMEARAQDFRQLMASVARHALDTNPLLTAKQKERLRDIERPGYYSDKVIRLLMEAMVHAGNPRFFGEAITGGVLRLMAAPSRGVVDTHLEETLHQGPHDVAAAVFIEELTSCRRDHALETGAKHLNALRQQLDALHLWTPNGRVYA